jgi:hypothetical protein
MPDINSVDAFITTAGDEFSQIYNTVNPPAVVAPTVTPIVYTSASPAGGSAVGIDLSSLVVIVGVIVGIWWLLRK